MALGVEEGEGWEIGIRVGEATQGIKKEDDGLEGETGRQTESGEKLKEKKTARK
jgi:hypothetical protein